MKSISECLGENVRRLRIERDLTQSDFAKRSKISTSFLQSIERGKKWVGPKTITTLARALKVSEDELFRDCAKKTSPDPKDILLMVAHAFGIKLEERVVENLKSRNPPSAYSALYEKMPDDICVELTRLCQAPEWDWEGFRAKLKA